MGHIAPPEGMEFSSPKTRQTRPIFSGGIEQVVTFRPFWIRIPSGLFFELTTVPVKTGYVREEIEIKCERDLRSSNLFTSAFRHIPDSVRHSHNATFNDRSHAPTTSSLDVSDTVWLVRKRLGFLTLFLLLELAVVVFHEAVDVCHHRNDETALTAPQEVFQSYSTRSYWFHNIMNFIQYIFDLKKRPGVNESSPFGDANRRISRRLGMNSTSTTASFSHLGVRHGLTFRAGSFTISSIAFRKNLIDVLSR